MKIAVMSDIHSNLEALEAVFRDMEKAGVDRIISLGDNIGYGADPEAVIQLLIRKRIVSVLGNHEQALMTRDAFLGLNIQAGKALAINRKMLSQTSLDYLTTLLPFQIICGFRFVHGLPPDSPVEYISRVSDKRLAELMGQLPQLLSFVGHTHLMALISLKNGHLIRQSLEKKRQLLKNTRYVINAGSVGQPRGGHLKAGYVIWDHDRFTVEPKYVSYDSRIPAAKIEKAGIPRWFAQRLL